MQCNFEEVNSLGVLHVILSFLEAIVDLSPWTKLWPFRIDSHVLGRGSFRVTHSLSPTECKGELWLNNSSPTGTYTRTLHTYNVVGTLLKLPPHERGSLLFNWCFGPPLMRAIDWPHNPWSTARQQPPHGVQTAPWEIQNPTITRKRLTRLFRHS